MRRRALRIRTRPSREKPTRRDAASIIAANKWDLMKVHGSEFVKEFDETLRRQLKFLDYAPILHISALTGERAPKLLETIDPVTESRGNVSRRRS
jgi:GTP-binding protein